MGPPPSSPRRLRLTRRRGRRSRRRNCQNPPSWQRPYSRDRNYRGNRRGPASDFIWIGNFRILLPKLPSDSSNHLPPSISDVETVKRSQCQRKRLRPSGTWPEPHYSVSANHLRIPFTLELHWIGAHPILLPKLPSTSDVEAKQHRSSPSFSFTAADRKEDCTRDRLSVPKPRAPPFGPGLMGF